ncbi:hypothetical protein [Kutzneria sp. NPDC052558]
MIETTPTEQTVLDEDDVLLPRGWADERLARDGEDEPNVLRGRE